MGKSPAIKDGKITFTGADPKQMPAADYWKWNGDEKKDLGVSASDSCCQKTCKSSGRTCTAKDGKEMMLKDGGKERCHDRDTDKCTEENFDGHCCVPKTCELDKCTANGNFDDDCGKDGPCPAACDLGGESSSDDLDKCAECSMKTKNEWCGGCLQCLHDLHLKYDSDTKKIKSDWKVKAKVEEKAPAPTPKPKSKLPTFAPTPKPTNPKKPTFEKAKHEKAKKKFKVVTKIADKTCPPTMAPTKAPTHKGYKIVKRKQKRKAAKATLAFPITAAEAKNPVMQEALTTGVANSLGKDPADVKIEFEVVSNSDDADAADQLKTDLETAATEGSIVANVQEAANEKGVLVQALQDMEPKMAKPTVKVDDVEVEVEVQEREEEQKQPPELSSGSTSTVSALVAATSAVAVMLGTCM